MTPSRPRKRVSAISAPSGTPMRAAKNTADKLTINDSRTMATSAGWPLGPGSAQPESNQVPREMRASPGSEQTLDEEYLQPRETRGGREG
jgi:hypothetical protein